MEFKNFFGISHPNGEMVLRAVKVLETEKDFIKQAEEYVRKTRGRFIPLRDPSVIEIVSNEDEWGIVGETDIEGERWMAYCSEIDYDQIENEKGGFRMDEKLKEWKVKWNQGETDFIPELFQLTEELQKENEQLKEDLENEAYERSIVRMGMTED